MKYVYVSANKKLNGALQFQSFDEGFNDAALAYLNRFHCLKKPENLPDLKKLVEKYGLELQVDEKAKKWYEILDYSTSQPFEVESDFFKDKQLRPYQHTAANLALLNRRYLLEHTVGSGKTPVSVLVAQKLIDLDLIDMVITFCEKDLRLYWKKNYDDFTRLSSIIPEGVRDKRHEQYKLGHQVLILNYAKARTAYTDKNKKKKWDRTDLPQLKEVVKGKRVLIVTDEAQMLGKGDSITKRGIKHLGTYIKQTGGSIRLLDLTATPYTTSAYNFYYIFKRLVPNLFEDIGGFENEYVDTWKVFTNKKGIQIWEPDEWKNLDRLGVRISRYVHIVDKEDPEIAAMFPKMNPPIEIPVEMDPLTRKIYNEVSGRIEAAFEEMDIGQVGSCYQLMRMICNTPEALKYSDTDIARALLEKYEDKLKTTTTGKFESICAVLNPIFERGEKTVLFSFWKNATNVVFKEALKKRYKDVPIFTYSGDMKSDVLEAEKNAFNNITGPGIFLASDKGKTGINLYASYLSHIEVPDLWTDFEQRSGRISRGDSKDKGIFENTIYYYVTQDTLESRVAEKMFRRRDEAAEIDGKDKKEKNKMNGREELYWAMFGKKL